MKLSLVKILESHVIDNGISHDEGMNIASKLGLDFDQEQFSFEDFLDGANHEMEHKDVVSFSPTKIAKIAVDHLREDPEYYKKLSKIER